MNPAPPEELAVAIRSALGELAETASAEDMLRAAETLLKKILASDCEARSSAIDLLTVDALVTQALLVASRDGNASDGFAEQVLQRISGAR
jgi:hypothetical protein